MHEITQRLLKHNVFMGTINQNIANKIDAIIIDWLKEKQYCFVGGENLKERVVALEKFIENILLFLVEGYGDINKDLIEFRKFVKRDNKNGK